MNTNPLHEIIKQVNEIYEKIFTPDFKKTMEKISQISKKFENLEPRILNFSKSELHFDRLINDISPVEKKISFGFIPKN